ncbi:hypothetical protein ILYODFUR_024692 [Ilyodon furcidens]|uniref:Uncharacterized protein n=1 Tax=Ilyodon furcidens TaxID=33524 RepID=A0ABV0SNZ6_9TELE
MVQGDLSEWDSQTNSIKGLKQTKIMDQRAKAQVCLRVNLPTQLLLRYRHNIPVLMFVAITVDFNHTSLSATCFSFVNCSTRENKTLGLFYADVKDSCISRA